MSERTRHTVIGCGFMAIALCAAGCDHLPFGTSNGDAAAPKADSRVASSQPPAPVRPKVDEADVLAWVGDTPVLIGDYEAAVNEELSRRWLAAKAAESGQPLSQARQQELLAAFTTAERQALRKQLSSDIKQQLLQGLVRKQLWIQDAEARGLERSPDVRKALEVSRRELLFFQAIRQAVEEVSLPTTQEVEQFYNDRKIYYKDPDTVQVRVLVLDTEDKAKGAIARLYQGDEFAALASEASLHESKAQGGLYGWVMQSFYYENVAKPQGLAGDAVIVFPDLEKLLFSAKLKPGSITTPVQGPDGRWWVAKVEAWREGRQKTFVEVEPTIREWLKLQRQNEGLEKRVAQLEQEARKAGRLKLFEEKLESL